MEFEIRAIIRLKLRGRYLSDGRKLIHRFQKAKGCAGKTGGYAACALGIKASRIGMKG
jgi:hypothetical protein